MSPPLAAEPFARSRWIEIGTVLEQEASRASRKSRIELGTSREGRPIWGHRFGHGPAPISLIAGCHADEPVGPAMLDRLAAYLEGLAPDHRLLRRCTWRLVPHVNPDGEERNRGWTDRLGDPASWTRADPSVRVDLGAYLNQVVREKPGDDLEFGFFLHPPDVASPDAASPDVASPDDPWRGEGRPEARAVADFLAQARDYRLHGSFHGMAFAAGPWFLIEGSWAERTRTMRHDLLALVEASGYVAHDIDRGGEKGFTRLGRGFTSRPDSRAMRAHFEALGDYATAGQFRPSSMEMVRSLGGDPLTLVSEMPLFCLPPSVFEGPDPVRPPATAELKAAARDPERLAAVAERVGLEPMPVRDQVALQLAFLDAALETVLQTGLESAPGADSEGSGPSRTASSLPGPEASSPGSRAGTEGP